MVEPTSLTLPPVRIEWTQLVDLWLLRLPRACSAERVAAAAAAIGSPLPGQPDAPGVSTHWVAPGEWLLEGDYSGKEDPLAEAMTGSALLVPIGPGAARLDLVGRASAELLNKGCSLDLRPVAFAVGHSTRTLIAGVSVVLIRRAEDAFRIYCELSFSSWLRNWLNEAATPTPPVEGVR